MSDDFFGDLGKTLTKAGQAAAEKTSSFFEATKLGTQIAQEQKEVEKLFQQVGEAVVRKYVEGKLQLDDAEVSEVAEIKAHKDVILELKKKLAGVRGQKVCPSCEELIAMDAAFCPKCGAPTPTEDEEAAVTDGTVEVQAEAPVQEEVHASEEESVPEEANATEETDTAEEDNVSETEDAETEAIVTPEAEVKKETETVEASADVADAEFTAVEDPEEEEETQEAVDAEFVTVDDVESPDFNKNQES